jgi:copper chaperone CopZ
MKTIKIICTVLLLFFISGKASANFTGARIKVTGVTCSMCSNSVHKALSSLPFVDKIEVDLQKAVFELTFKAGEKVVMDDIKQKVEGAGFSVGELIADFKFENVPVKKDYHYEFDGNVYHFVNVKDQTLNNTLALRFVDKGMTSSKEHKKYVGLTTYACIKTGKAQSCCSTSPNQRIYHITL